MADGSWRMADRTNDEQSSSAAISHQPSVTSVKAFAPVVASVVGSGLSVRFRATGDSMWPTILSGDVVTVAPVALPDISTGDVLLYRDGDRVLAHRFVGLTARSNEPRLHLRGDANIGCDRPVAMVQVVGRVTSVERG